MAKTNATGATTPQARATKTATKVATKAPVKAGARPAAKAALKPRSALPAKSPAPAKQTAPKQAIKPATGSAAPAAETKEKARKPKLVRDSFTMPEAEYAVLGDLKKACLKAGVEIKKSELLRVGVALLRQLDPAKIREIVAGLPTLKAGRPKKSK